MKKLLLILLFCSTAQAASEIEQYFLAEALYFEASTQSDDSQLMIAAVILNRVAQTRYSNTIQDVVHAYKWRKGRKICQFSYYCDGKSDEMRDWYQYRRAWLNAGEALSYDFVDPTDGADHYYNPKLASPAWGPYLYDTVVGEDHIFGKLDW